MPGVDIADTSKEDDRDPLLWVQLLGGYLESRDGHPLRVQRRCRANDLIEGHTGTFLEGKEDDLCMVYHLLCQ